MITTTTSAKETYAAKKKTIKRYTFFLAALFPLFVFNFEFGFIDLLPDFIGLLFLVPMLSSLRDLNDKLDSACRRMKIVALLSLSKFVAIFVVFGFIATEEGGYSSSLMAFGLIFGILDVIFVTDAFRTFFDGMDDLAQNLGCTSLIKPRGVSRRNRTDGVKLTTVIFIVARALCAVLPEVSTISMHTVDDSAFPWANFTGLFRVFGATVCFVFGVVWLVRMLIWIFSIARDKEFVDKLTNEHAERLPTLKTKFILRDSASLWGLISIAAFFCVDIFFEQNTVNLTPDLLCAALMAVAVLKGRRLLSQRKKQTILFVITCSLWGVLAILKDALHYSFYQNFSLFAIYRSEEAYTQYWIYSAVCILSAVGFLISILLACSLMRYLNNEYAVSKFNTEDETAKKILENEHEEIEKGALRPIRIFAVISAVFSALAPFAARLSLAQTTSALNSWGYRITGFLVSFGSAYGFVDGLVALIFACLLARGASMFKQRIEGKLMLE